MSTRSFPSVRRKRSRSVGTRPASQGVKLSRKRFSQNSGRLASCFGMETNDNSCFGTQCNILLQKDDQGNRAVTSVCCNRRFPPGSAFREAEGAALKMKMENRSFMPEAMVRSRSLWRRPWLWLLVLAIAAGAAYVVFKPGSDAQSQRAGAARRGIDPNRPTSVVASPATSGDVNVYLNGLGTVTPLKTVTVRSRVDGELIRVLFNEGQVVKAGDLLAQIDPRQYQAQLEQMQGQLARDQALLDNARIDLERYRKLLSQDSIPEQQVATQVALVRQYEGIIKLDMGQVDNARLQVEYTRITAPISGRLGLRQVDPGNIVPATDTHGL